MKVGKNLQAVDQILVRHKSTIGREVLRNSGLRLYRSGQTDLICRERAQSISNAFQIDSTTRAQIVKRLKLQCSPDPLAAFLPVRHEIIYQDFYAEEAQGGSIWKYLRYHKKTAYALY